MDQPNPPPKEPRGPVSLRIKFRSANLDQFIDRYAVDVSRGGIFIRTREPLAVGTQLKFDFQLQDAAPLLAGEGTVVWIREHDPSRAGVTPGMGVRFDKLTPASQPVLEKILSEKGSREPGGSTPGSLTRTGAGMAVRRPSNTFGALEAPGARIPTHTGMFVAAPASTPAGAPKPPLSAPAAGAPPASKPLTLPTSPTPSPAGVRARGITPPPPPPAPRAAPPDSPKTTAPGAAPLEPAATARPRAITGIGTVRPAPAPPALFEPPTSADIDKALEALTELPGGDSAPPASIVDDQSNEVTRIAEPLPEFLEGRTDAGAKTVPESGHPDQTGHGDHAPAAPRTGTQPLFPSSVLNARPSTAERKAAPALPVEPEPSDRTELSIDPTAALAGTPDERVAPPPAPEPTLPPASLPPRPEPAPAPAVAPQAAPAVPPAPLPAMPPAAAPRRSRAPQVAMAAVLLVGVAGAVVFFRSRQQPQPGTEVAATAPATPAAEPAPAPPAPTAEKAAAPAAAADQAPPPPTKVEAPAPAAEPERPAAVAAEAKPAGEEREHSGSGHRGGRHRTPKNAEAAATPAATDKPAAAAEAAGETGKPAEQPKPAEVAKTETAAKPDSADKKEEAKEEGTPAVSGGQHVLRITSTPAGAEVVVDGASVGKTPFLGKEIDPGAPHAITLKKDGYENHEHMISASDWSRPHNGVQTLKLNVKLRRAAGAEPVKTEGAAAEGAKADKPAEGATPAAKPKDEAPPSP